MVAHDVEEYSYEEIEQLTGMCVNNIRVALSRARRSVREMYTKMNELVFATMITKRFPPLVPEV